MTKITISLATVESYDKAYKLLSKGWITKELTQNTITLIK